MLLIDTYNLYHTANVQYGRMVDYDKLIRFIQEKYQNEFPTRFAYVSHTEQSRTFVSFLRGRKFIVRSKIIRENKLDTFDVELTIDAMSLNHKNVVICSSSLNLLPLVQYLTNEGCIVVIHSCGIPHHFRELCVAQELPINVMRTMELVQ